MGKNEINGIGRKAMQIQPAKEASKQASKHFDLISMASFASKAILLFYFDLPARQGKARPGQAKPVWLDFYFCKRSIPIWNKLVRERKRTGMD